LDAIQGVKERKPEVYDIYSEGLSDEDNTEVRQVRKSYSIQNPISQ